MPQYRWLGLLLWLIALALVSWTLSHLPLEDIGQSLSALGWEQWSVWALVNGLVIIIATVRWQVLLRMLGHSVGFFDLVVIKQAGQTISFITPGPQFGGEPLQIYWLYKRTGMGIHSAVLALGIDRFYELWINFLVLMMGVILLLLSPGFGAHTGANNWQQILVLMSVLLLLLSALAYAAVRQPQLISGRLEKLSARWLSNPRLMNLDHHWHSMGADLRLAVATKKPALLKALMLSVLVWVLIALEMWLVLGFFDITLEISGLVLILVAMRLALLLPLPGGIGTLEASVFWSFQLLQLSPTAALAVIAIMRLRDALVLIAGLACLRVAQNGSAQATPVISMPYGKPPST
ncbi:MAG: lysylphosphatidylglycerol synthase transmembrane domain-containing protein [Pseudohongiella sp.]|nr:lysylphosphatidylglycerol synthase transmembrane domain-containing protein [Pseudohongiella sp.]MDO9520273.1 lysylphosphatidylglycerol synthase transmembrane domain-containing protein [Pseudohongiella sp.]MDP2127078.1 lysylphosphatidylglycerol synthase transmembrane domain-containing protein [Pseudohongiella sp.]